MPEDYQIRLEQDGTFTVLNVGKVVLDKMNAIGAEKLCNELNSKISHSLQKDYQDEKVDVAIANLVFSGLSLAQMEKIPKWMLENIEKNKPGFKEFMTTYGNARELEGLEITGAGFHDQNKNMSYDDHTPEDKTLNKIAIVLTTLWVGALIIGILSAVYIRLS